MNEMNGTNEGQRAVAEEYLSGFLSNNSNMGELLSVRDLWKVAAFNKHATGKELKRLHNRARNAEGKARRIKQLRKQMTFEGADADNTAHLLQISSFDDATRKGNSEDDSGRLFYDSDPEDARHCNKKRGPRVAAALFEESSSESKVQRREVLDILDNSRFGLGRKWRRVGQEVLFDIIEVR